MNEVILEAHGLCKVYPARGLSRVGTDVEAVHNVDLAVARGSCLAIVGESGSGKSTLVRLLLALERPTAGRVEFDGLCISEMGSRALRPLRRRFQAVFQEPTGSLNPKLRVATIVAEPLVAQALGTTGERRNRAKQVLEEVGLCGEDAHRFPSAFSAGERQRIAIARALAPSPELLILDEPVAALDATVQARILNLIDRLRHRRELSVVLVSHDLAVVRGISDHVTVMFRGAVIEQGPTTDVLDSPAHPYTRELREAAPGSGLQRSPPLAPPVDDSSAFGAEACRYAGRCPSRETRCASEPPLVEVADGRRAACWLA